MIITHDTEARQMRQNIRFQYTMNCLQSLLTDNALCDSLGLKSYKRGGDNAGILHEVQKKG